MRLGTSGFVGARLKEAREARGVTGVDLADMLSIKPQTVYAYQSGDASPSPQVMEAISDRLGFPLEYFRRPAVPQDTASIFWRANSSATRVAQLRAEVRLTWMKELMGYFRGYFDFPPVNMPPIQLKKDFRAWTGQEIEDAAVKCRHFWGLGDGPLPDVTGELEANGVVVSSIKVGVDNLDAFSQWSTVDNTPYVILGLDKSSACRGRFDAAHELGHLILHKNVDRKRVNDSKDWKTLEDQAHRFASAFLMPADSFSKEVWAPSLDTFIAMKRRWKASAASMIMRCKYLGLINEDQEKRLWINRNRRGWQKSEPLDDKMEREATSLVPKAIAMLVDENVRRKEQILIDTCLPATDLEEVTSMPFGYFREKPAPVIPIPKAFVFPSDQERGNGGGVVVPFGRAKGS